MSKVQAESLFSPPIVFQDYLLQQPPRKRIYYCMCHERWNRNSWPFQAQYPFVMFMLVTGTVFIERTTQNFSCRSAQKQFFFILFIVNFSRRILNTIDSTSLVFPAFKMPKPSDEIFIFIEKCCREETHHFEREKEIRNRRVHRTLQAESLTWWTIELAKNRNPFNGKYLFQSVF